MFNPLWIAPVCSHNCPTIFIYFNNFYINIFLYRIFFVLCTFPNLQICIDKKRGNSTKKEEGRQRVKVDRAKIDNWEVKKKKSGRKINPTLTRLIEKQCNKSFKRRVEKWSLLQTVRKLSSPPLLVDCLSPLSLAMSPSLCFAHFMWRGWRLLEANDYFEVWNPDVQGLASE